MPASPLTLIGGPTVLIEYGGIRLLTDPTFDPPGEYKGAHSPVVHKKTSGPALSVDQIGLLDAVLLSHDHHFDNLDNAARALLPNVGATYTTNYRASGFVHWRKAVLRREIAEPSMSLHFEHIACGRKTRRYRVIPRRTVSSARALSFDRARRPNS